MKLEHLYTKQILIARKAITSGYKSAMTTLTSCYGHFQPLSFEKSSMLGGAYGKTYVIYCDIAVDIKDGDQLRDVENGDWYEVKKGASTIRNFGNIEYQKLIVEKL